MGGGSGRAGAAGRGDFDTGGSKLKYRDPAGLNLTSERDWDDTKTFIGLYIGMSAWPDVS